MAEPLALLAAPEYRPGKRMFHHPLTLFGPEALEQFAALAPRLAPGGRALVVTDPGVRELAGRVAAALAGAGLDVRTWDQVVPEPPLENVAAGAAAAADCRPDLLVAVGGGSTIDAAKAIWVLYEMPGIDLRRVGLRTVLTLRQKARLAAVPTTGGTGSEASTGAVLTDTAVSPPVKFAVGNSDLLPDVAVLDPRLMASLPPRLTMGTGLDALTHATEAYLSGRATIYTDMMALQSIALVFGHLPRAVSDGTDLGARLQMAVAANLGGSVIANGAICLVAHSLGHALGKTFGVHHGLAVAAFLPQCIAFNAAHASPTAGKGVLLARWLGLPAAGPAEAVASLIRHYRAFYRTVGGPQGIPDLGVAAGEFRAHLDHMVATALQDDCTKVNPRPADAPTLRTLFERAWAGDDGPV